MIHPEFKPLSEIWNNKLFRIPEYQRHYSWQLKQRKELFDDIKKLEKAKEKHNDRIHFMATIVCLKTQESVTVAADKFYIYDVVDGQQRLTTLIILPFDFKAKFRNSFLRLVLFRFVSSSKRGKFEKA